MTINKKQERPPKAPKESKLPTGQAKKTESDSLIRCAFCRGTGIDRFGVPSKLSKCQTCKGGGKVFVPEPHEECPSCLGSGVYRYRRLSCSVCGGKGRIRKAISTRAYDEGSRGNEAMAELDTRLPPINAYELGEVKKWRVT